MTNATDDGTLTPVFDRIAEQFDHAVERTCDILRIPSVGTDPAHDADTKRAAEWFAEQFRDLDFTAEVIETDGQPMVVASCDPPGVTGPTVLYYGHYDVQPPDPLELWDHPPFEPTIVDGPNGPRIVARGAVDDKGQTMTWIEAFRAWRDVHGTLPIRVRVLLEGEEESGSPSLVPFLRTHADRLAADVCVISDTGMWSLNEPAMTTSLRGLVYLEATLVGPSHDLHSGQYGGAVTNPLNALSRILAQLHDDEGRVQIEGFYDDVEVPTDAERAAFAELGFDAAQFLGEAGLAHGQGEAGWSTIERIWCRPTCDVNGLAGGYQGPGAKTVIASEAMAKISCRLVANQDPEAIMRNLQAFLEARTPVDASWRFESFGVEPAFRVASDSPYLVAAESALRTAFGCEPRRMGTGGSLPVVGRLREFIGVDSLLVGFGLSDDRVHSPNEKFELACLRHGIRSHAALLHEFAQL